MSFFIYPRVIHGNKSYFAAANTAEGFRSFFDETFGSMRKIIIKGGPGTGKSTLMRRVAEKAASEGVRYELFYCSSDTDSLDAVCFPEYKTAIVDGTLPHATEPLYAGAYDTILNLGDFWDSNRLTSQVTEIREFSERIASCYRDAYRLLAAASSVERCFCDETAKHIKTDKMEAAAEKTAARFYGSRHSERIRINEAVGVHGVVRTDAYEADALFTYAIRDKYCVAPVFFDMLREKAEQRRAAVDLSFSPPRMTVNAIGFTAHSAVFITEAEHNGDFRTIDTARFVSLSVNREKEYLRSLRKIGKSLTQSALQKLYSAGSAHDRLEAIYISAMDFDRVNSICDDVSERLFGRYR